jgi:hypothetical protein
MASAGIGQKIPASLEKHDSGHAENEPEDFEVASPMAITHSGDPLSTRPSVNEKKPILDRHISRIPADGVEELEASDEQHADVADEKDGSKPSIVERVKAKLLPNHHRSDGEDDVPPSTSFQHGISSSSSDVEVVGVMPSTNRGKSGSPESPLRKPGLERHITAIPED